MIYLFTINYQNVFAFVLIVCLKYFSIIQRKEELLFKHCKQYFFSDSNECIQLFKGQPIFAI